MRIQKPSPRETAEQATQRADAILFELERTPLLLEVLCRLGVVWAKLGKPERAQNAFSAARALLAELPCDDTLGARMEYACTVLGTALALAGQVEQARQLVATTPCIERDTVLQRVSAVCTDVGSLQEALAIALAIQDATTQGMALESLANEADARRQFALRDQALAQMRNPLRRADTLYHIVRRRLENRAFAEARALLREATHAVRATRKLPERADWLTRLATAYIEAQAPQDALPLLAEAETLLPKLEPYMRGRIGCQLVQGYARAGQQARARQLLQRLAPLLKQQPEQARDFLHQFFAEAHTALGEYMQAEHHVRRIQDTRTRANAWLRLARALLEANLLPEATRIVHLAHEVALKANLDGYFIVDTLLDYEQYDILAKLLTPANWSRLKGMRAWVLTRLIEKGQWQLAASYAPRIESAHERERAYLALALARARANDLNQAQAFLSRIASPLGRFWGYWSLVMEKPAAAPSLIPTLESLAPQIELPRARATARLGMAFALSRLDQKTDAVASLEQAAAILASLRLLPAERAIYLPLLALGWARCGQSQRAAETLQLLSADADVQREVGVSSAARCLAELGNAQALIDAALTVEQLRGAGLETHHAWASALLAVAEALLGIAPHAYEEKLIYGMLCDLIRKVTGAEAFDPYNLTLPLFTGEMPETNERDAR
jgi:hypothetical protein